MSKYMMFQTKTTPELSIYFESSETYVIFENRTEQMISSTKKLHFNFKK